MCNEISIAASDIVQLFKVHSLKVTKYIQKNIFKT